mmetsp:Transcript_8869/g.32482  ORF Transcript_8869/g.32482 Transcript_8869/m.32482 type:complete len:203 (-) Transcript_8869:746-1354(-)
MGVRRRGSRRGRRGDGDGRGRDFVRLRRRRRDGTQASARVRREPVHDGHDVRVVAAFNARLDARDAVLERRRRRVRQARRRRRARSRRRARGGEGAPRRRFPRRVRRRLHRARRRRRVHARQEAEVDVQVWNRGGVGRRRAGSRLLGPDRAGVARRGRVSADARGRARRAHVRAERPQRPVLRRPQRRGRGAAEAEDEDGDV